MNVAVTLMKIHKRINQMSKAEQIGHLCIMISANIDHCRSSQMDAHYGYIDRLQKLADDGGYAAENTLEIMSLDKAEQELLRLADAIKKTRNHLLENSKQFVFLKVVGNV